MKQENNCQCCGEPCTDILHGGTDVCVGRNDCDVQANITVDRARSVMIWGVVTDCTGTPVSGALVRLLRYSGECGAELREVCRTCTNCQGYYQFDLERGCEGRYRVAVSSCPPCPSSCHSPCGERPAGSCGPWDGADSRCGQCSSCRSTVRNEIQYY